MAREKVGIERTILCATRFWGGGRYVGPRDRWVAGQSRTEWSKGPTPHTLMPGVKKVVRAQGYSTDQINKALKKLEKGGFIETKRGGLTHASIRLTAKGGKVSCSTVKLSPWTDDPYPGSQLSGCGCGRKR